MSWLLDTNIVSELRKPKPDPLCIAWVEANEAECFLSVITLAELRYGIERLPYSKRRSFLQRHYEFMLEDYRGRVHDLNGPAVHEWADTPLSLRLIEARIGGGIMRSETL
jgi:toxin FitB